MNEVILSLGKRQRLEREDVAEAELALFSSFFPFSGTYSGGLLGYELSAKMVDGDIKVNAKLVFAYSAHVVSQSLVQQ